MDGENHGKPYLLMDDLGGTTVPLFSETSHIFLEKNPSRTTCMQIPWLGFPNFTDIAIIRSHFVGPWTRAEEISKGDTLEKNRLTVNRFITW